MKRNLRLRFLILFAFLAVKALSEIRVGGNSSGMGQLVTDQNDDQQNQPNGGPRPPQAPQNCVYSKVISSFMSSGVRGNVPTGQSAATPTGTMTIRETAPLSTVIAERRAGIERQRREYTTSTQQELSRLTLQEQDLQKRKEKINAQSTLSAADQAQLASINQSLIEVTYSKNGIVERARLDEVFYERQLGSVTSQDDIHPVLQSVYTHQNAIVGNDSLRPLAREIVSYTGLTLGGPAGLVIGSLVGNLFGGKLDQFLKTMKEKEALQNMKIEDLTSSLQEVCKWHSVSTQLSLALFDETTVKARKENKDTLLAKIKKAEDEHCSSTHVLADLQKQLDGLKLTMTRIQNRIRDGQFGLREPFENNLKFQEMLAQVPKEVRDRLKKVDATSIEALYEELVKEQLSLTQLVNISKPEAKESNRLFFQRLRETVEKTMGEPTVEEKNNLRMILSATQAKLKTAELNLQKKALVTLHNEYEDQRKKISETYKESSRLREGALNRAEISYLDAVTAVNERAKAMEAEEARMAPKVDEELARARARFQQSREGNPLNTLPAPSEPANKPFFDGNGGSLLNLFFRRN